MLFYQLEDRKEQLVTIFSQQARKPSSVLMERLPSIQTYPSRCRVDITVELPLDRAWRRRISLMLELGSLMKIIEVPSKFSCSTSPLKSSALRRETRLRS